MSGSGVRSRSSYKIKRAASSLGFTRQNTHGTPQLVQGNMSGQRTESFSYFSPNVHRGGTVVFPDPLASPESVSSPTSNSPRIEPIRHTLETSARGVVEYASIVATPNGSLQRPSIATTPIDEPEYTPPFTSPRNTQVSHPRPALALCGATSQILSKTFSSPTTTSKVPTSPTSPISPTTLTPPKPAFKRGSTGTAMLPRPRSNIRLKTTWVIPKTTRSNTIPTSNRHDSGTLDAEATVSSARYEVSPGLPRHRPSTGQEEECVYVLTLKTDEEVSEPMTRMRESWFLKALNRTPAHLTLFHALPHSQVELVKRDLSTLAARTEPFQVGAGRAFRMRQGVGINLGSGAKKASILHDALRSAWLDFLSEQDKGTWRPHWTVQNKENDEGRRDEAMLDVETVIRKEDVAGRALGFDLWKYDNGNWVLEKEVVFGGSKNWMGS